MLADEPIASLDPESSRLVMDLLREMNQAQGCTVLVSLHQVNVAIKYCPRTIALRHGDIVYDGPSSELTPNLLQSLYGVEAESLLAGSKDHNLASLHNQHATLPDYESIESNEFKFATH